MQRAAEEVTHEAGYDCLFNIFFQAELQIEDIGSVPVQDRGDSVQEHGARYDDVKKTDDTQLIYNTCS